MGGRGSSSGAGGGGGGSSTGFKDFDGSDVDLSGYPLKFGGNDAALSGAARTAAEAQENKRRKAKIEYAKAFDGNGNMVHVERKGGHGSVSLTYSMVNSQVVTHNHPREAGVLGGTFSQADINNFADYKMQTHRAAAKEGTYSISKGKNFDAAGTKKYVSEVIKKAEAAHKQRHNDIWKKYKDGKMTYKEYVKAGADSFNKQLVEMHNGYAAGAKKYGYTYTLERSGIV